MLPEDYKALVRYRFYRDAVDLGNLNLVDELFSPNCAFYAAGSYEPVDRATFKQYLNVFRTAFGFHHTVDEQIGEGNVIVARWTVRGTHQGEFLGRAATGKPLQYSGVSIFYFAEGKIQQVWSSFDELGLHKQIGLLPA